MSLVGKVTSGVFSFVVVNIVLVLAVSLFAIPATGGITINGNELNTLSGKVTTTLNKPISKAKVIIHKKSSMLQNQIVGKDTSSVTVTTNTNGKFKIENISKGTYMVKVKADGFKTSKKQVAITKDKSITVTLKSSR